MRTSNARIAFLYVLSLLLSLMTVSAVAAGVKGIYLTQGTLENTPLLNSLIVRSKAVGINTFVIDMERPTTRYENNIALVKANNIAYVARITMFPGGGTREQVASDSFWKKRFNLVESAVRYGANEIQLDYIRYNTKQPALSSNSQDILRIIQWFKARLSRMSIPLQIDVFGISAFGESKHIGQNLQLFTQTVDALCPMVYPSHYEPYLKHAVTPYETVYSSLKAIKNMFDKVTPTNVYAWIELSNYRYPLTGEKRLSYIAAELKAVKDSGADGWYAWSAGNHYEYLFKLLQQTGAGPNVKTISHSTKAPEPAVKITFNGLSVEPIVLSSVAENHFLY